MSNLVIVESPTKARTLSRFLGSNYRLEATMGHIRDLPEKKLGIIIKIKNQKPVPKLVEGSKIKNNINQGAAIEQSNNETIYEFLPQYQIIPDRRKRVSELKNLAQSSSSIILATDPDREGEAIAWHVAQILRYEDIKKLREKDLKSPISQFPNFLISRIVFHEITESAIKHALSNPRDIDMNLVDAQQGRRVLDRLVGYKLSPLLWNKLGKNWLSAGRVQTVAVRLIVEREREIGAFKPQEYWLIEVELKKFQIPNPKFQNNQGFLARLIQIGDKKAEIKNKKEADKIVEDLKAASYKVTNIEVKDVLRFPSPPFTTSTLQQAASTRFGWSAKRVMRTAQSLYEEGLITYHRTDSTNLAMEAIKMVRSYINNVYGKDYLPASPKFYKTKSKVAQEAHEAIRPTTVGQISNLKSQISNEIGREGGLLYELIWRRFVACQMKEAVSEQTTVSISAKRYISNFSAANSIIYLLKAVGEKMKFDGWLMAYGQSQISNLKSQISQGDNNKESEKEKRILPELNIDEKLNLIQVLPQQKFTEPPPRYTEATLIKALEEKGIGRPSTYAPIISTIQERKYVEKIERKFHPTPLGFPVNDFLVKYFPEIFDIGFTAKMENELDSIANGKRKWNSVVSDFYTPFIERLDKVYKEGEKVKVDLGTVDEKCPSCQGNLAIRLSKYGKFLACTNYPRCTYTKNMVEKIGLSCPRCGGEMVIKRTRRGKQFYGCSHYPKCIFAAWKKEEIK